MINQRCQRHDHHSHTYTRTTQFISVCSGFHTLVISMILKNSRITEGCNKSKFLKFYWKFDGVQRHLREAIIQQKNCELGFDQKLSEQSFGDVSEHNCKDRIIAKLQCEFWCDTFLFVKHYNCTINTFFVKEINIGYSNVLQNGKQIRKNWRNLIMTVINSTTLYKLYNRKNGKIFWKQYLYCKDQA